MPSLVASVKDVGLLLATFGDTTDLTILRQGANDERTVDAFVQDGLVICSCCPLVCIADWQCHDIDGIALQTT